MYRCWWILICMILWNHQDPVSCIGWESDGGLTNVPKSVKGKKRARLEERKRAAFPRLGLGTSGGSVLVLDLQTGETTTVGTEHEGKVSSVAWSTQRDVLFSCGIDTRVCKWDLSTGTLSLKWKAQEPLTSMCYSSGDGKWNYGCFIYLLGCYWCHTSIPWILPCPKRDAITWHQSDPQCQMHCLCGNLYAVVISVIAVHFHAPIFGDSWNARSSLMGFFFRNGYYRFVCCHEVLNR